MPIGNSRTCVARTYVTTGTVAQTEPNDIHSSAHGRALAGLQMDVAMTYGTRLFFTAAIAGLLMGPGAVMAANDPVATAPIPPPPPAAPLTPAAPAVVSPDPPPKPKGNPSKPAAQAPKAETLKKAAEAARKKKASEAAKKEAESAARPQRPKRPVAAQKASAQERGPQKAENRKSGVEKPAVQKPSDQASVRPRQRPEARMPPSGPGWGAAPDAVPPRRYYGGPQYYAEPRYYAGTYPGGPAFDAPSYYPPDPAGYAPPYPPPWYDGPPRRGYYAGSWRRGPMPPWYDDD